ncbi:MAG: hypothetical protein COA78_37440 [Blastopirellula sp.]|nr:MAG: hypothetical protein COA78_37440 [Blastopirellula sp.]
MVSNLLELHMMHGRQALEQVRSAYADSVDYFGKITTLDEVMQDKRRYFDRWPSRDYRLQNDTIFTDCSGKQVCTISGYFDWSVQSEERGKKAAGTASFEYAISSRPPHQVVKEISKVVNR